MARYRKVEVATWNDDRFLSLSRAEPNGQTLWLYMLCGPRTTTFPGLVVAREEVIASDLGWLPQTLRQTFAELSQQDLVKVDWKVGLVFLRKALFDSFGDPRDTARPSNPNQLKSWAASWEVIPECLLKFEYLQELELFAKSLDGKSKGSTKGFHKAFREAYAKPLAKGWRPQDAGVRSQDSGVRMQEERESQPAAGTIARLELTESKTTKSKKPRPDHSPEAISASQRLLNHIISNHPSSTLARAPEGEQQKTVNRWAGAFRLLHEKDRHSWSEITEVIDWCHADDFWKATALSAGNIRANWDTITAQRSRKSKNGAHDGYDVRYGRARLPAPEEYDQPEDPFGSSQ